MNELLVEITPNDVDRLQRAMRDMHVHQTALAPHNGGPAFDWDTAWAKWRERFPGWMKERGAFCLAAERGSGEVIGFALCTLEEGDVFWDMGERVGYIDTLAVVESERGKGIGTRLIDASLERFRGLGLRNFYIDSMVENEDAIRLYERYGRRESIAIFGPLV